MQAIFDHLEFRLGARDAFSLDRAAAAAITVLCGIVWVTQDGKSADHVLRAGQSLRVDGDAKVLLSALTPAQVSVDASPRVGGKLRRLARRAMAWYLRGFRGATARASRRRLRTGLAV